MRPGTAKQTLDVIPHGADVQADCQSSLHDGIEGAEAFDLDARDLFLVPDRLACAAGTFGPGLNSGSRSSLRFVRSRRFSSSIRPS